MSQKEFTADIRTKRVTLYALITALSNLVNQTDQGHINVMNAWNSMKMARGWLGKSLGFIGEPNPYPAANKAKDIPPTADTSPFEGGKRSEDSQGDDLSPSAGGSTPDPGGVSAEQEWDKFQVELNGPDSHVHYINALRGEVKNAIEELNDIREIQIDSVADDLSDVKNGVFASFAIHQAWIHLHECSMHLGFQLETIRKSVHPVSSGAESKANEDGNSQQPPASSGAAVRSREQP